MIPTVNTHEYGTTTPVPFTPKQEMSAKTLLQSNGFSGIAMPGQVERNRRRAVQLMECARMWDAFRNNEVEPFLMQQAFNPTSGIAFQHLQKMAPSIFTEGMNSGTFSSLTDNFVEKALMAKFQSAPTTYRQLAKINNRIRDFRSVYRYKMDGMQDVYEAVAERAQHNTRQGTQTSYNYAVSKYEAGYDLSWEAMINDDIGIFDDMLERLGQGGVNSIEKYVTGLYVDASGPHASFYTSGNANIVTSNPVLSLTALQTAFGILLNRTDAEGLPMVTMAVNLVVGNGTDWIIAQNLKNQLTVDLTTTGGASDSVIRVNNWLISKFNVIYNPWIRVIATGALRSWFLFGLPSIQRPAMEVGFLQGYETPALYKKMPNTIRVGGGVDEMHGDFNRMVTEYKGMVVYGGTRLDPNTTVGSNGSGS